MSREIFRVTQMWQMCIPTGQRYLVSAQIVLLVHCRVGHEFSRWRGICNIGVITGRWLRYNGIVWLCMRVRYTHNKSRGSVYV